MNKENRSAAENSWLEGLRAGDEKSFQELFNGYKELLYRHAFRMVPDHEVCRDIIQDIFLALWAGRERLRIDQSLDAYLFRAVRNRILDYFSHRDVVNRYVEDISNFAQQGICYTDDYVLERELAGLIEIEKASMSVRMREVYEMNREQQMNYKEIGEKLAISEKTAKKQVHNALKILRSKFGLFLILLFFLFFLIF